VGLFINNAWAGRGQVHSMRAKKKKGIQGAKYHNIPFQKGAIK